MQTEYDYLRFVEKPVPLGRIAIYSCRNLNSDVELGVVSWHAPWRGYCYFPTIQAVYSPSCLKDIVAFIAQLHEARAASLNPGAEALAEHGA